LTVQIFISYSQDDFLARGIKIRNYLSRLIPNSDVYIDQNKSKGQDWQKENDEKLDNSHIVIVILTPAALQSHEIAREVVRAQKQQKRILPCKDDNLDLPWKEIPWGLSKTEGITFEEDEVLKTRLYREVIKIIKDLTNKRIIPVAVSAEVEIKAKLKHGDIPLIFNNRYFNIPYFVKQGTVSSLNAKIDPDALSVLVDVTCKDETEIEIALPRTLIDSKLGLDDNDFFVLVDRHDITFEEEIDEKERTITLSLAVGSHSVEIIGNQLLGISIAVVSKPENKIRVLPNSSTPHGKKYLEPEILRIKQGEAVTWLNDDSAAHTVTSGTRGGGPDGVFDSSLFMAGSTYEITFNNKGTFDYFCMVHPWKTGKIIVE